MCVKNSKHKNQQAITPGMAAALQATFEQEHLKPMGQHQQAANKVDQHIERVDQGLVQITQHQGPNYQCQCFTQPPKHPHTSAFSMFFGAH